MEDIEYVNEEIEKTNKNELSFEESLAELETIVKGLESGDIPLDEAIEQFNKAMILVKECDDKLNSAEKAIAKIVKDNNEIINMEDDETFI